MVKAATIRQNKETSMKTSDPQAMVTAWMSQLTDQNSWPSWLKSMQPANANPIADILKEAGAKIAPATATRLQNEYAQQLATLWQNFLVSKGVATLTDRRFSSAAWQSNAFSSFRSPAANDNARRSHRTRRPRSHRADLARAMGAPHHLSPPPLSPW